MFGLTGGQGNHREDVNEYYELLDTAVFDDEGYLDVVVEYAKQTPDDILMLVTA